MFSRSFTHAVDAHHLLRSFASSSSLFTVPLSMVFAFHSLSHSHFHFGIFFVFFSLQISLPQTYTPLLSVSHIQHFSILGMKFFYSFWIWCEHIHVCVCLSLNLFFLFSRSISFLLKFFYSFTRSFETRVSSHHHHDVVFCCLKCTFLNASFHYIVLRCVVITWLL